MQAASGTNMLLDTECLRHLMDLDPGQCSPLGTTIAGDICFRSVGPLSHITFKIFKIAEKKCQKLEGKQHKLAKRLNNFFKKPNILTVSLV